MRNWKCLGNRLLCSIAQTIERFPFERNCYWFFFRWIPAIFTIIIPTLIRCLRYFIWIIRRSGKFDQLLRIKRNRYWISLATEHHSNGYSSKNMKILRNAFNKNDCREVFLRWRFETQYESHFKRLSSDDGYAHRSS